MHTLAHKNARGKNVNEDKKRPCEIIFFLRTFIMPHKARHQPESYLIIRSVIFIFIIFLRFCPNYRKDIEQISNEQ